MTTGVMAAAARASAPDVGEAVDPTALPLAATRVLIVHEVRLSATVLRVALAERAGLDVLPDVPRPAEAVTAARQTLPQVVVMGLGGRTGDGLTALRELREAVPAAAVLVLLESTDPIVLTAALGAGARGYLTMDAGLADVVEAIRAVAAGEVVPPAHRLKVVRQPARRAETTARCDRLLTKREREVLRWLVDGETTKTIAKELGVSPNTARTHIQNVLTKLQVHSRLEAAARAVQEKLV